MPKNTKKQKDKSADFKKAKLKLGKGKKPASNAVDTSFKAHSIALPSQSINTDKSQAGPSTKRRQTLAELLSLLRHYSAGTRKDALAGLRELFSTHGDLMNSSISTVASASCRLISDEDGSVRKTLVEFQDWYLHRVSKASVLPHAPTLMLLVTSAQSHIFPEIRVDSIKLIDVFLDVFPEVVTSEGMNGHASRVMQGYMGLLVGNAPTSESNVLNASTTILSPQSKLTVIASLSRFLKEVAARQQNQHHELWYLRNSFKSMRAYESFNVTNSRTDVGITLKLRDPLPEDEDLRFGENYGALSDNFWQRDDIEDALRSTLFSASTSRVSENMQQLILKERVLHHLLIEVCLDYAPTAFINLRDQKDPLNLRIIHSALQLALSLYTPILQNLSQTGPDTVDVPLHLNTLTSHLSVYLPISEKNLSITAEMEDLIQHINLDFSKLYTILLLWNVDRLSKNSSNSQVPLENLWSQVSNWTRDTISASVTFNHPMGRRLSETLAQSLLPILWTLISQPLFNRQIHSLLQGLLEQIQSQGVLPKTKNIFIRFMAMLILLQDEPEYVGAFRIQSKTPAGAILVNISTSVQPNYQLFQQWVLHLPKLLWEIGANDPMGSLTVMDCLLRCIRNPSVWATDVVPNLCQRFVPFFAVEHAARGQLLGPFRKFPSTEDGIAVQKMALDVAFSLHRQSGQQISRTRIRSPTTAPQELLRTSVDSVVLGTAHEPYWSTLKSLS